MFIQRQNFLLMQLFLFIHFSVLTHLVPNLKAKWKGLRDMFRVEIKRIPRNDAGDLMIQPHEFDSKWTHYRSLLFLGNTQHNEKLNHFKFDANRFRFSFSFEDFIHAHMHTN